MNRKYLIPILSVLSILVVAVELIFFSPFSKKDEYSTIYLEINPSIEIKVDKNENVVSVKALNDDAKEIVDSSLEGKPIDELFKDLSNKIVDMGYSKDNQVTMLIHTTGSLDSEEVINKIRNDFQDKDLYADIIVINNISSEDEEFAKTHNISPYKAAYLNSIKEEKENINIEELVDKPIREIQQTKETGNTCDDGYTLEGDLCLKEIERIEAKSGSVCPSHFMDYNGKCYEETPYLEKDNDICNDNFTLVNGKCINKITDVAEGVCNNGSYDSGKDVCHENVYIGDAYEFCRDSGRTLYEHKCLATKPTINGGCLNGDMLYNGKCVNTRNDYYASEWMCPNGQINSTDKGTLIFPDNKCYEEQEVKPTAYKCNEDFTLENKTCVREESHDPQKERYCPNGFTMVPYDRCINLNNQKDYETGFVCDKENSRLEGNVCVVYEIVDAKKW